MTNDMIKPLSREELIKAVERKSPRRIPLVRAKWWGEGLEDQLAANDPELARLADVAEKARREDRYTLFGWLNLFFERPWMLQVFVKRSVF